MVITFSQHFRKCILLFSLGKNRIIFVGFGVPLFFLILWMCLGFLLPIMARWFSLMFLGVHFIFMDPGQHLPCFFKLKRSTILRSCKLGHFPFEECLSPFCAFSPLRMPVLCLSDNLIISRVYGGSSISSSDPFWY